VVGPLRGQVPHGHWKTISDDIKLKDTKMEAAIIFESHLPDALRRTLEYAGDDGFLASMPQVVVFTGRMQPLTPAVKFIGARA